MADANNGFGNLSSWIKTAQTLHSVAKDTKRAYDEHKSSQGSLAGSGSFHTASDSLNSLQSNSNSTLPSEPNLSSEMAHEDKPELVLSPEHTPTLQQRPASLYPSVHHPGTVSRSTWYRPGEPLELNPAVILEEAQSGIAPNSSAPVLSNHMPDKQDSGSGLFQSFTNRMADFVTTAKERILGEDFWIPNDVMETVAFPSAQLAQHRKLLPDDSPMVPPNPAANSTTFGLYIGQYRGKNQPTYHVACTLPSAAQQVLSIHRSADFMEASDIYHGCLNCRDLFILIDKKHAIKDVRLLMCEIKAHPLWDPVHIAAQLGINKYFADVHAADKDRFSKLLNLASQPEGSYVLQIAISKSQIELVKQLLDAGAAPAKTDSKGDNAMHYAAVNSAQIVELLAARDDRKALISALNNDGCTPLFSAIRQGNARCTMALIKHGAELNIRCKGRSLLHEAMQQNNDKSAQVIRTLVESMPPEESISEDRDAQSGNTALHAAAGKRPLGALLAAAHHRLDINATNNSKQTALHLHAFRAELGCVITLVAYGINLDAQDADGNTALHIAVSKENLELVRALLVLGANANLPNDRRDTPRHLAARLSAKTRVEFVRSLAIMGAQRCRNDKVGCAYGCVARKADQSIPGSVKLQAHNQSFSHLAAALDRIDTPLCASSPESSRDNTPAPPATRLTQPAITDEVMQDDELNFLVFRHKQSVKHINDLMDDSRNSKAPRLINVLSLDGGGIRGLMLLQILLALEDMMDGSLVDYVDWQAGTSTGSFVASGLCAGKSLREMQRLYLRFKDQVFEGSIRPYNTKTLESFIKSEMGEETTLADIKHPRLAITTCTADHVPCEFVLLRNYQLPIPQKMNIKLGYPDPKDEYIWRALRKSSAAPTFFSSVDGKYVDGGMIANNPTLDLMAEVENYNSVLAATGRDSHAVRIGCVLSVGCGRIPDQKMDSLDFDITGNPLNTAKAMTNLGFMLIEQVTATEGVPVQRARTWAYQTRTPFYRFSTPMSKLIQLDTKEDSDLVILMWDTVEYIHANKDQLTECAALMTAIGKSDGRQQYFSEVPELPPKHAIDQAMSRELDLE